MEPGRRGVLHHEGGERDQASRLHVGRSLRKQGTQAGRDEIVREHHRREATRAVPQHPEPCRQEADERPRSNTGFESGPQPAVDLAKCRTCCPSSQAGKQRSGPNRAASSGRWKRRPQARLAAQLRRRRPPALQARNGRNFRHAHKQDFTILKRRHLGM